MAEIKNPCLDVQMDESLCNRKSPCNHPTDDLNPPDQFSCYYCVEEATDKYAQEMDDLREKYGEFAPAVAELKRLQESEPEDPS